ncbi:MAG: DUF3794 domain-containing protein [Oscillospiraceae bacterium]|nr:DUF3794 domain-containing protein [Oscillospiraceae bacterium]
MDGLELKKKSITSLNHNVCSTEEVSMDCDLTLPDYLPEVSKILKCIAVPGISSTSLSGSRITAEGSTTIRILYLSEKNEICTYEQGLPFSKYIESMDYTDAAAVDCEAKVGYINCRAVSQRRLDIHGALSLRFLMFKNMETEIVLNTLPSGIEKRECSVKNCNCVANAIRYFSINHIETLKEEPCVRSIVRSEAYGLVNEVKVIKDKSLIKGDIIIWISYVSGDSCSFEHHSIKVPISQIVDAVGLDENEILDTTLTVMQLNIFPKADVNGDYKLLDVSAKVKIELHAYMEESFTGITDAYSTKQVLNTDISNIALNEYKNKIMDTFLVEGELGIAARECGDIKEIWASDIINNTSFKDGVLIVDGTVTYAIITVIDGDLNYFERNVDFEFRQEYPDSNDIYCIPHLQILGTNSFPSSTGGYTVKTEVSIEAHVFERVTKSLVNNITSGDIKHFDDGAAIVLYFANCGENVWDIARRYNSTVGAIIAENNLEDEVLKDNRMLLIPR